MRINVGRRNSSISIFDRGGLRKARMVIFPHIFVGSGVRIGHDIETGPGSGLKFIYILCDRYGGFPTDDLETLRLEVKVI